jgi:hypothetical protein
MLTIAARFTLIVADLRKAVAAFVGRREAAPVVLLGTRAFVPVLPSDRRPPLPAETWALLCARLGRAAARFQALFDRWRANALPMSRARSATARPHARAVRPAAPRLPRARTWVVAHVGWQAAGHAAQLQHLLDAPEIPEFLAAAPQAGRILRPLCHMLGIPQPDCLRLPPRPRPSPPTVSKLPAGAAPAPADRPLPACVRAAIRAWKRKSG